MITKSDNMRKVHNDTELIEKICSNVGSPLMKDSAKQISLFTKRNLPELSSASNFRRAQKCDICGITIIGDDKHCNCSSPQQKLRRKKSALAQT